MQDRNLLGIQILAAAMAATVPDVPDVVLTSGERLSVHRERPYPGGSKYPPDSEVGRELIRKAQEKRERKAAARKK